MSNTTTTFGYVPVTRERPGKPLVWRAAARFLEGVFKRMRAARQIRRDLAFLQACDDRTLADIGLTRTQIDNAIGFGRYY
jgi:uncharacterized protein YjiS (DUF1127 family)